MRRLKFRVQTLMMAVALVAALTAGSVWAERSATYRRQAIWHSHRKLFIASGCVDVCSAGANRHFHGCIGYEGDECGVSKCRAIEYHEQLRQKYDGAARSPWLPVAPDPPSPYEDRP